MGKIHKVTVFKTVGIKEQWPVIPERQETKARSPPIAPAYRLNNFQDVTQGKGSRWSPEVPLSSEDRTKSQGRTKQLRVCRADAGGELPRVRALVSCKGGPWVFSWAELSTEDATQGQGKNHQRIRGNNAQDSHRARNDSCCHQSFENLIIRGAIGSVLSVVKRN